MKNKYLSLAIVLALVLTLCFSVVACGDKKDSGEGEKTLVSISIDTASAKTEYEVGDLFDKTGLKVYAVYSDGTREEVTDYTVEDADTPLYQDGMVMISYKDQIDFIDVKVAAGRYDLSATLLKSSKTGVYRYEAESFLTEISGVEAVKVRVDKASMKQVVSVPAEKAAMLMFENKGAAKKADVTLAVVTTLTEAKNYADVISLKYNGTEQSVSGQLPAKTCDVTTGQAWKNGKFNDISVSNESVTLIELKCVEFKEGVNTLEFTNKIAGLYYDYVQINVYDGDNEIAPLASAIENPAYTLPESGKLRVEGETIDTSELKLVQEAIDQKLDFIEGSSLASEKKFLGRIAGGTIRLTFKVEKDCKLSVVIAACGVSNDVSLNIKNMKGFFVNGKEISMEGSVRTDATALEYTTSQYANFGELYIIKDASVKAGTYEIVIELDSSYRCNFDYFDFIVG